MLPSDSVCPYTETATGEPRSTPRKVSKETETPKNQEVIICLVINFQVAATNPTVIGWVLWRNTEMEFGVQGFIKGQPCPRFPRLLPGTLGNFPGCL